MQVARRARAASTLVRAGRRRRRRSRRPRSSCRSAARRASRGAGLFVRGSPWDFALVSALPRRSLTGEPPARRNRLRRRGSERPHHPGGDRGRPHRDRPVRRRAGPAVERSTCGWTSRFRVFHNARYPYIDVRSRWTDLTELVEVDGGEPFILHPGEFVLGQTLERVTLPDDLVARLEGKSSLGRLGLLIHSTAGFVDSGFSATSRSSSRTWPTCRSRSTRACRSARSRSCGWTARWRRRTAQGATGSKYQGQAEPTPSRFYENFPTDD